MNVIGLLVAATLRGREGGREWKRERSGRNRNGDTEKGGEEGRKDNSLASGLHVCSGT